ncbi:MAG TPA: hypothetical protein VKB46_26870 [Pyrinomonadaceae bacterium]|nr:hypothetical protein [Pyrinomonadaceae bacterium]
MVISTPNFASKSAGTLTPTMIRGAFLVWSSYLQLGKLGGAEIKELGNTTAAEIKELGQEENRNGDSHSTPEQLTPGASDDARIPLRKFTRRNLASWGDDLRGTLGWEEDSSLR